MARKRGCVLGSKAKAAVRRLWLASIAQKDDFLEAPDQPLYLTLAGSEALDIQLLVDKGLVTVSETKAILPLDQVIAFERSPVALAALKQRFSGLRVFDADLVALMKRAHAVPPPVDLRFLDAAFINLDLFDALEAEITGTVVRFPVIEAAVGFAHVKAARGRTRYGLFLTINATLNWSTDVRRKAAEAVRGNIEQDEEFRNAVASRFGREWVPRFQSPTLLENDGELARLFDHLGSQRFLQLYLPKAIAYRVHSEGWRVTTRENWRYRGYRRAPMVTFVFDVERDPRAAGNPRPIYLESLRTVLNRCGQITATGKLVQDEAA